MRACVRSFVRSWLPSTFARARARVLRRHVRFARACLRACMDFGVTMLVGICCRPRCTHTRARARPPQKVLDVTAHAHRRRSQLRVRVPVLSTAAAEGAQRPRESRRAELKGNLLWILAPTRTHITTPRVPGIIIPEQLNNAAPKEYLRLPARSI